MSSQPTLPPSDRRLYAIVDVDTCLRQGYDVIEYARRVCAAHPRCVQLRAKQLCARDTFELLRRLIDVARPLGIAVFANDRPDIAWLSHTDGVHVGQADLPVPLAQRAAPGLLVGVSTHNELQLREALCDAPDYVAFGPIFPTSSKPDAQPSVGLAGLETAAQLARAANIPIVAIGGITCDNVAPVAKFADWVAVISALIPQSGRLEDVTTCANQLNAAIASVN
jgi:thiamine-phosphate pyrophosphorylase